ncbi:pyridoxamine 5'-phosphate oxidase family protein [uncultured Mucilaginibacter sp.]|uniref:pyridoxamine 5'-phosphate oxidase family protein n=1 Tax=uncultured Mucilaginibacter sp. TaxID=797541 RepID=UPI00260B9E42|nr:pyridoxamine 5'-phosphate oxidase family protein [uncultured Mucilaginibacter sp.]
MSTEPKADQIKFLKDKIEDVRIAMLVTVNQNHEIHARPMGTAKVDDEGNIWFFTNEYSSKVDEVSHENKVVVTYSNPSNNTYLSIKGTASLVDDKEKMKELWNPIIKAFFPDGIDDPKLTLLKVDTQEAEYWDSNSSKMVVGFQMLKAIVTGGRYDQGDHGKIQL